MAYLPRRKRGVEASMSLIALVPQTGRRSGGRRIGTLPRPSPAPGPFRQPPSGHGSRRFGPTRLPSGTRADVGRLGDEAMEQHRPLDGIRVVDVTQEAAGPITARMLAEMGADVVHVEPLRGDNGRNTTTPFLGR